MIVNVRYICGNRAIKLLRSCLQLSFLTTFFSNIIAILEVRKPSNTCSRTEQKFYRPSYSLDLNTSSLKERCFWMSHKPCDLDLVYCCCTKDIPWWMMLIYGINLVTSLLFFTDKTWILIMKAKTKIDVTAQRQGELLVQASVQHHFNNWKDRSSSSGEFISKFWLTK